MSEEESQNTNSNTSANTGESHVSAGPVIKKIHSLNPQLSVEEILDIIKVCTKKIGMRDKFNVIDEERALEITKATLL